MRPMLRLACAVAPVAMLGAVALGCSGNIGGNGTADGGGPGTPDAPSGPPADAHVGPGNCTVFPSDNAWNTPVTGMPIDPLSDQYLASIGLGTGLHPDFGTTFGIPYVDVTDQTARSSVAFQYASESDPGPYPIPPNPPIEAGSDHHILMVETNECKLYELFGVTGGPGTWQAGSGAIWDLKTDSTRPAGWTSADAAGLPIFPGLARYEEATAPGGIQHALRFTVVNSQQAYVAPASHFASSDTSANLPPMGLRVRLKASVDISGYPPQPRAVLQALKTYGMIVADNGSNWFISGAPDSRWSDDDLHMIGQIKGSDFEVVKSGPLTTN